MRSSAVHFPLQWIATGAIALALSLSLTGCAGGPKSATPDAQQQPPPAPQLQQAQQRRSAKIYSHAGAQAPQDARQAVDPVVQLDLYRITVPFGTISANEALWKSIDEQCVDVATYDLLFKNGLRVGRAATAQWDAIARLIAENPATTRKSAFVAAEAKSLTLPMKHGDDVEHIFYYDARNTLLGRSYERWENYMELSFQNAPRKPMHVRIALVPAVRSLRKRLEFNFRNEEQPVIEYVAPERMYDLNLRADLPPDTFLIVAPSSEGRWPTSIGSSFLLADSPAERMEQVLVIVPKPLVLDATAKAAP